MEMAEQVLEIILSTVLHNILLEVAVEPPMVVLITMLEMAVSEVAVAVVLVTGLATAVQAVQVIIMVVMDPLIPAQQQVATVVLILAAALDVILGLGVAVLLVEAA
jgi:hypothetical protein